MFILAQTIQIAFPQRLILDPCEVQLFFHVFLKPELQVVLFVLMLSCRLTFIEKEREREQEIEIGVLECR